MNGHNRLIRRNHTYYIRARIPVALVYLVHRQEFQYSLQTNNYYEALAKLSKESHKIDVKINILKALDMLIKNKQLVILPEDIDKMVIHKLRQAEEVFENYDREIAEEKYDYQNLLVFNKETPEATTKAQHELECVELFIKEYFKDLKESTRTHHSIVKMIGRVDKDEIPIIADKTNPSEEIKQTARALKSVEKYVLDKINSIVDDTGDNFAINNRVKRCLTIINEEKNARASGETISTPWKQVFKDFALDKKNNNRTGENTLKQNKQCLETIFEIIGKSIVEQITADDCRKVSQKIHNLPKKWKERYRGQTLTDILARENDDVISLTSVKKYLRVFKEFLEFCKVNQYIHDSFQGFISISRRKESIEVTAFTKDELKKIFDPKTYPRVMDKKYAYRYWIPLLALFHPVRLNEVCQLYIEDVRLDKGVWYLNLTDERKDQHLKNPQSRRRIPIHPQILDLGFLEYINSIREASNKTEEYPGRVFYQLHYSPKNHYIQAISQWFGRYLKSVGIDSRSKVFHSYRHNVKQAMRDADIPQEFQNALAGWSGKDTGERVYGGNFPIKKLNTQLSKLHYTFLNRNLERIAAKNKIR